MIDPIEKKLYEMPVKQLVKIIQAALIGMGKTEQIDFIAKHIDARTSLSRLGANDPDAFLSEIKEFCLNCLNSEYYSDEDDIETYFSKNMFDSNYYDDEWDYDEYYNNTEWAETFSRLFKLSMMYIQSGDYETGYDATARLLSCLNEMMSSESYLGTSEPMSYITVEWNDLFTLHYDALFKFHKDDNRAIEMAFKRWLDFGSHCDEGFLTHVKNISLAERFILGKIKSTNDWKCQRGCFELLAELYARLGESFDKANKASALIDQNQYFYLMMVDGLCEMQRWDDAIDTAKMAIQQILFPIMTSQYQAEHTQKEIRAAIQSRLADAYEQRSEFLQAYETVNQMFKELPSYVLYKRARVLSEKVEGSPSLLSFAEKCLKKESHTFGFLQNNLLRDIYSFEGETEKLLNMAKSHKISENYYDQKYIARSLIFRAIFNVSDIGNNLVEYISNDQNINGISDMMVSTLGDAAQSELLLHGTGILREIVSFHINAATRNRYAKAAYYVCVMRDIYIFLVRESEFRDYFNGLIRQNSRRPALRDEMSIVYGKEAVKIKK